MKGFVVMNEINEEQVLEYISYNIKQTMQVNNIQLDEAVESVRYYMDYLVNHVASQMEN